MPGRFCRFCDWAGAHAAWLLVLAILATALMACDSPATPTPICTLTVTPASQAFPADGGSATVEVVASVSTCAWSATSDAAWAVVTSGAAGTGSGTVAYRVDPNATTMVRTTTLRVGVHQHAISQQGQAPASCSWALAPAGATLGDAGGAGSFTVMAPDDCPWTATSSATWTLVTAGASGTGPGQVSYAVAENNGPIGRTATISVADQRFTIAQLAEAPQCTFSVAPVLFTPCMVGGVLRSTVTAPASCQWTVAAAVPWITITSGASGEGTGQVVFDVPPNYDAPRAGIVMVRWDTPTAGQNISVQQAGCIYGVSQTAFGFAAGGGAGAFDVLQQSLPITCGGALQNQCIWSAVSDVPWIVITTGMPRQGDNPVAFSVAPNTTGVSRSGTISVRGITIQVTQAG